MLNKLKITFIVIICMGYTMVAQAQKVIKEGTVIYTVEYDLPPNQQSMAGMLPKEFKVTFNDTFSRFKMDMGMFSTDVIFNTANNEMLSLTEVPMQNKKIAVKMNAQQSEKMREIQSDDHDFDVSATTETKRIAGYNCVKYLLKDKVSGEKSEIWTSTDIQIPTNTLTSTIKDVKGVPIQFSKNTRGMKSKMTIKSITEDPVKEISFEVPPGFETISFDELMTQMGN